jgi:hypothetical protein
MKQPLLCLSFYILNSPFYILAAGGVSPQHGGAPLFRPADSRSGAQNRRMWIAFLIGST